MPWTQRTSILLGQQAVERLAQSAVIVFGAGGVGGYAIEALARAGVGRIGIVDSDTLAPTNLNRQILALHSTLGLTKTEAAKRRILDINPDCTVDTYPIFYLPDTAEQIDLTRYQYVIDCIDTVRAKVHLLVRCHQLQLPAISCMGAARKLDPTAFRVIDISRTQADPLARAVRQQLRRAGVDTQPVVFSPEPPQPQPAPDAPLGSCSFVPPIPGLIAAAEAIKTLLTERGL